MNFINFEEHWHLAAADVYTIGVDQRTIYEESETLQECFSKGSSSLKGYLTLHHWICHYKLLHCSHS